MVASVLSVLAALLLSCGAAVAAAPLDPEALRHIPTMDVIRLVTTRYQILWVEDPSQQRDGVAAISAMPSPVRTLIWLAVMESDLTIPSDFPPAIVLDGHFKTQMAQALDDAGLADRAALFRKATAALAEPAIGAPRPAGWTKPAEVVQLGEGFGHKAAFDQAILRFVADNPAAANWVESQRFELNDEDRLRALETGLARSTGYGTATGMRDWPVPLRVIALADLYTSEVDNGGMHQFFANSTGDVAPETAEAMLALGLPKQAETLRKAMTFFPTPYPSDRDRRSTSFDHKWAADWDDKLNDLTGEEDDGTIQPAMIAYAKRENILPR